VSEAVSGAGRVEFVHVGGGDEVVKLGHWLFVVVHVAVVFVASAAVEGVDWFLLPGLGQVAKLLFQFPDGSPVRKAL